MKLVRWVTGLLAAGLDVLDRWLEEEKRERYDGRGERLREDS